MTKLDFRYRRDWSDLDLAYSIKRHRRDWSDHVDGRLREQYPELDQRLIDISRHFYGQLVSSYRWRSKNRLERARKEYHERVTEIILERAMELVLETAKILDGPLQVYLIGSYARGTQRVPNFLYGSTEVPSGIMYSDYSLISGKKHGRDVYATSDLDMAFLFDDILPYGESGEKHPVWSKDGRRIKYNFEKQTSVVVFRNFLNSIEFERNERIPGVTPAHEFWTR